MTQEKGTSFVGAIRMMAEECHEAWRLTLDDHPEKPISQEVGEEWRRMSEMPKHPSHTRLNILSIMLNQSGHTIYHSLARRRERIVRREQAFFEFFQKRVGELRELKNARPTEE